MAHWVIWPVKVVFIALVFISCLNKHCMQEFQLSEADNGKKLQLQVHDHVVIKLPANPGTGYNWEVQPNNHFNVSHQYKTQADAGVGAGGMDVFELDPQTQVQSGSIKFLYKRAWESGTGKEFSVSYQIQ
ncbi:Proteinase inhibitor I42, chagasin [Niastella koreensis GR20-10]|uniref:Proteinase inhibitor I42, chagasin n=2 Tax=Niastella koreensis TaxID=354356 RepID=G8TMW5_NIAKG|nr:Proteinase inhibitor I42, chagasin [Niastella koreensis GR20-10]